MIENSKYENREDEVWLETNEYSFSVDFWKIIKEKLPLTYESALEAVRSQLEEKDKHLALTREGYLVRTMKDLEVLDDLSLEAIDEICNNTLLGFWYI